jgi:CRP-like cAMP-binding protein
VVIIESGVAKAVVTTEDGAEVALALRGPGDILGELAAVAGGRRSASVVAVEPIAALVLSTESFRSYLHEHPGAALVLLGALAERNRDATRRHAEFGTYDTRLRLARLIAHLAETYGEPNERGVRVRLLTQDELASFCAASREAVARALRTLRDEGLVETGRRTVTVTDLDRLRTWRPG